eukprot:gene6560-6341_t
MEGARLIQRVDALVAAQLRGGAQRDWRRLCRAARRRPRVAWAVLGVFS